MEPDFSFLFHQSSKDHNKGHPPAGGNSAFWPKEWKTVYYKAYHRFPKIALPETVPQADFFELIKKRQSRREFTPAPVSLDEIGSLLKYSCGTTSLSPNGKSMRRAQPSGGARFPIEIYPIVLRPNTGIPAGVYHYNVKAHALDILWERTFSAKDIAEIFTYKWVQQASIVFVMTAVFQRNQMKYGERGYRYMLIEAGHIGQNFYLTAEALKLRCCGLGGTYDEALEKTLDIDGVQESVVYAITIGQ